MSLGDNLSRNDGINEELLRAYLLRRLSHEQSVEIEQRIASDPELRDLVEAIEEELFDDHARGRLLPSDSAAFRLRYLAEPEGLARAEFAAAFAKSRPVLNGTWLGSPTAQVLIALSIAAISFAAGRLTSPGIIERSLRPGFVRSAGAGRVIEFPARAAMVAFRLYPDTIAGDWATILTLDQKEVAAGRVTASPDGGRRFVVPAEMLGTGDYLIRLTEKGQTIATFFVHLRKK